MDLELVEKKGCWGGRVLVENGRGRGVGVGGCTCWRMDLAEEQQTPRTRPTGLLLHIPQATFSPVSFSFLLSQRCSPYWAPRRSLTRSLTRCFGGHPPVLFDSECFCLFNVCSSSPLGRGGGWASLLPAGIRVGGVCAGLGVSCCQPSVCWQSAVLLSPSPGWALCGGRKS